VSEPTPRQLYEMARADVETGRFERAREICLTLLRDTPAFGAVYFMLGVCERRLKNFVGSIDALSESMKVGAENAENLFQMACAWHDLGNYDEAARWYRMALAAEPTWAEAMGGLGQVLMFTSKRKAIDSMQAALKLNPRLHDTAYQLAAVLFDEEDTGESRRMLETVLAIDPAMVPARFFLGVIDWLSDDDVGAEAAMRAVAGRGFDHLTDGFNYMRTHRSGRTRFFGITPDVLEFALGKVGIDGAHLEFGVSSGNSTRFLAARTDHRIHGFDSFEGIPEVWAGLPKGSYTTRGTLPPVPENVTLHAGWYSETAPAFMRANPGQIAFANIDCDLYSSTRDVFDAIGDAIAAGTILVFDEYLFYKGWRGHEYKAFQELVTRRGLSYEYLAFGLFSKQAVVRIR
jgi:hypothetical protein